MRVFVTVAVLALASPALTSQATAKKVDPKALKAKYDRAKKFFQKGKYEEAQRIFTELRNALYHPILDYWIGRCYEGLKAYGLALEYYNSYLKYRDDYRVAKTHPSKEEVKQRIQEVTKHIQAPPLPRATVPGASSASSSATSASATAGTMTPTGSATPAAGTAAAGTSGPGTLQPVGPTAQPAPQTTQRAQVVAPPPPPPPPRRRASAYDPYMDLPGPYAHRRAFPNWTAMYLTADFGAMGLVGDTADNGFDEPLGSVSVGVFYRPFIYASIGVFGQVAAGRDNRDIQDLIGGMVGIEARGHLPLGVWAWEAWLVELWAGANAGYLHWSFQPDLGDDASLSGVFVGGAAGLRVYVAPWLTVGAFVRTLKPFYTKSCDGNACVEGRDNISTSDLAIYAGFSSSLQFYFF